MDKDILNKAGINYEEGLERFMGHADRYEYYLKKFIDDDAFLNLESAMVEEDFGLAFELAHSLKGSTGNLSINRLYKLICPFVESLRNHADVEKACADFPAIKNEYRHLISLLKEAQKETL